MLLFMAVRGLNQAHHLTPVALAIMMDVTAVALLLTNGLKLHISDPPVI